MKITITDTDSLGGGLDLTPLYALGEVTVQTGALTEENAGELLKDAAVVAVNKSPVNKDILDKAPDLKLVCTFATGYDIIDVDACTARGIKVANVRGYSTDSVAQHTFALYFALSEHLRHYDDYVKDGSYAAQNNFCCIDEPFHELAAQTYGIIGMGNIGHKVGEIAQTFGAKVIFASASGHSTCTDFEQVSMDELFQRSDVISLHCPLTDRTRGLIDANALHKMKKSAILINIARGPVVDENALVDALNHGEIAAAGLDVMEHEPMRKDSRLFDVKDKSRLLLTPHIAWASTEARQRCVDDVCSNIKAFLAGAPTNLVN